MTEAVPAARRSQFQEINPDDPTHEQYASQLVMALIAELENKATSLPSTDELFVVKLKLTDCANMFKVGAAAAAEWHGTGRGRRCAVGGRDGRSLAAAIPG